ncbi:MAG: zinc-ribbon domain-containing protein [Candidatus Helarchaeota archaeon]
MALKCDLCGREIDTSVENVIFYCPKCRPAQIYCSTCERENLSAKGVRKKVLCAKCGKPIKLVKNLKKLPKEIKKRMEEGGGETMATPELEIVEDNEFVQSYGRFCAECGTQLIEGAKWCPECGKKIE